MVGFSPHNFELFYKDCLCTFNGISVLSIPFLSRVVCVSEVNRRELKIYDICFAHLISDVHREILLHHLACSQNKLFTPVSSSA